MLVSPATSSLEPCTVIVSPALRSALPPMLSVLPTLRLEKASVVVVLMPYTPPPTPTPEMDDSVLVVTVFSRATMLRLPPASILALPPTVASVPASVMSLPALASRLPPTVRPDLTWLTVVVVVDVNPVLPPSVKVPTLVLDDLSCTVSNTMFSPALSEALPPAPICAPILVMSLAASSDKLPVAWMPAVLPTVVAILPAPPVVCAAVSFLMLPSVDFKLTSPPLMLPERLLMSPFAVMASESPPTMVPPTLAIAVTSIVVLSAAMTAPASSEASATGDRYTTGASTFWPSTSTSTIQMMLSVRFASCSAVGAFP